MRVRIPGSHPLLEGSRDTSRVLKVGSMAEAAAVRGDLERVVRAWREWRSGTPAAPKAAPRKARAHNKALKKAASKSAPLKRSPGRGSARH